MSNRDQSIDGLRAVAVIGVVACHVAQLRARWGQCEEDLFWHGACGAHLLMIISGFSMAAVLSSTTSFAQFVLLRFMRVYPTYAISVAISTMLIIFCEPPCYSVNQPQFVANLLMCQSWLEQTSIDGAYWLVAPLLKFYALIGCAVLLGLRNRVELFAATYLAAAAMWRLGLALNLGLIEPVGRAFNSQFAHLFVAGMILWCIRIHGRSLTRGLAFFASIALEIAGSRTPGASLCIACLMLLCFCRDAVPFLRSAPLKFVGQCSHAAYMIHGVLAWVILKYLFGAMPLPALIALTYMSVFVAANAITQFLKPFTMSRYRQERERFELQVTEVLDGVKGFTDWRKAARGN